MDILHGDFETRSACDLKKCGADVYARHPSTDILCFGYAFNDEPVSVLRVGEPLPIRIIDHIQRGGILKGQNVPFEWLIWNYVCVPKYGWPHLPPEQVLCVMAQSYAMSLPGALENTAPALGIKKEKDMAGNRIMIQLSKPRDFAKNGNPIFYLDFEVPEKFESTYNYCAMDVEVEREVCKNTIPLSPKERGIWLLDHKINQRGVMVDIPAIKAALKLVDEAEVKMNEEMSSLTDGMVGTCSATGALTKWLNSLMPGGVEIESVAKAEVTELLEREDLPDICRQALELRQKAGKTSTRKLEAMLHSAGPDSRVRGLFQYHGAATGRWAGRRIQPQNFPRNKIMKQVDIDQFLENLPEGVSAAEIELYYGPVLSVVSESLRGFLIAKPGHKLVAVDLAAIEGRVLMWLAGEETALHIYATTGKMYEFAAASIYRVPMEEITKGDPRRQIGKVAELALGYQGGKGAFQSMAANYEVEVTDEEAEAIKNAWRAAHPMTVKYWANLEDAAIKAVRNKGHEFKAGAPGREVVYKVNGSFLWCKLPSGRVLCYPYPELHQQVWGTFENKRGGISKKTFTGPTEREAVEAAYAYGKKMEWSVKDVGRGNDSLTYKAEHEKKWLRHSLYGGLLSENNTQAVARDVLVDCVLLRAEALGYATVMHVHDEGVFEVPENFGSAKELEKVVSVPPEWAKDLPLAAEGWEAKRYRK